MKFMDKSLRNIILVSQLTEEDIQTKHIVVSDNKIEIREETEYNVVPNYVELTHCIYFTFMHIINGIRYNYDNHDDFQDYSTESMIQMMSLSLLNIESMYGKVMEEDKKEEFKDMMNYFNELFCILAEKYDSRTLFSTLNRVYEYIIYLSHNIYDFSCCVTKCSETLLYAVHPQLKPDFWDNESDTSSKDKASDKDKTNDTDEESETSDDEPVTNQEITNYYVGWFKSFIYPTKQEENNYETGEDENEENEKDQEDEETSEETKKAN